MIRSLVTVLVALLAPAGLTAQQIQHTAEQIHQHLFAPELVMQYQRELGITSQQRSTISELIRGLQHEVVDLEWQLQSENQRLLELVQASPADADAAVEQMERVLDAEGRIKTRHLRTLIQLKNALTPEQQQKLHELMARAHESAPGHTGQPGMHQEMSHPGMAHPGAMHSKSPAHWIRPTHQL
jgi:Spy/CpxP family protein refolding chaperone